MHGCGCSIHGPKRPFRPMSALVQVWIPCAVLTGFAAGIVLHRTSEGRAAVGMVDEGGKEALAEGRGESRAKAGGVFAERVKSTDTVESLAKLGAGEGGQARELVGLLAAWLCDADEGDLAALWNFYRNRKDADDLEAKMILTRWMELDPQGALRATEGTGYRMTALMAWGEIDPEGALKGAEKMESRELNLVLAGIAGAHPERVRELLKRFPDQEPWNLMVHAADGLAQKDPQAAMELLMDPIHGFGMPAIMTDWLRKDPRGAFDWLMKQRPNDRGNYLETAKDFLRREHPEVLEEFAKTMPEGAMRRELERSIFEGLIERDPAAALEQARNSETERLTVERYALVGQEMAKRDPEGAFQLMAELLAKYPQAKQYQRMTYVPDSSGGGSVMSAVEGMDPYIQVLAVNDPGRTVEMLYDKDHMGLAEGMVSEWLQRDASGFAEWLNGQQEDSLRDYGVVLLSSQLASQGQMTEAVEWAMNASDGARVQSLTYVALTWSKKDPEGMRTWMDGANLSARDRQLMGRQLEEGKK